MGYEEELEKNLLKTGNPELDRMIGGIPTPSLNLVEGINDSGKSVFVQQVAYGALNAGFPTRYVTTENTIKSLLSQMKSITLDVTLHFIVGRFRITPLHIRGIEWNEATSKHHLRLLVNFLRQRDKAKIVIVDSLTYLVTHATLDDVLDFFSECRNLVDYNNKTLFLTIHPYAFEGDMLARIRSVCDGHFILKIKEVRERTVRMLEVAKLRGAQKIVGNVISFVVDPVFGLKIVPLTQARL